MLAADLNDTYDVGHSAGVEHFIKFRGHEEVKEVVEGVRQEPAERGEELQPAVGQVTQPSQTVCQSLSESVRVCQSLSESVSVLSVSPDGEVL